MVDNNYIIINLGASSDRVVKGSFNGQILKMNFVYRFDNNPIIAKQALCWDYLNIYAEIKKAISLALRNNDISSIDINKQIILNVKK